MASPTEPINIDYDIIQGGVHSKVVAKLEKKLEACGYTPTDPKFFVVLFSDYNYSYDLKVFGLMKTDNAGDLEHTNIHPIPVRDPTLLEHWQKEQLRIFYSAVDMAKAAQKQGKKLIIVCMKGAHRSKAVHWALDPKDGNLPACESMRRAAQGYRDDRTFDIVPLGPVRGSRSKSAATAATVAVEDDGEKAAKKPRKE